MKLSKVIINSVTVKDSNGAPDPNLVISWETEKDDEAISEAEIILPISVNDLVDINNGNVVEIHAGWTTSTDKRYFYGFVDKIVPDGARLKLICKNEMSTLVRRSVNKVYDSAVVLCNQDYYRNKWTKFPIFTRSEGCLTIRFYFLETMMNGKTMWLQYNFNLATKELLEETQDYGRLYTIK